ncbi:MAG TPA: efflux RND transporter periplasmic adaptor subunit [Terriglobia bacterium]|nr:efflux RND transporter periplasmic adaptor subunit [Terriglobia bacterium]
MKVLNILTMILWSGVLFAEPSVEATRVVSRTVDRQVNLPGEIFPFLSADLYAKVSGFVENVAVDRGSVVQAGQLLITLTAPEITAHLAEAKSKVKALISQKAEAQAKRLAAQSTADRLKAASETPGAVAGNELELAEKAVDAARASELAVADQVNAATGAVAALEELQSYLKVTAPFSGIITARSVHPGALAGPGNTQGTPLLRIEQISRLRLTVAVPEAIVGGLARGARVSFGVPAYPGQAFAGTISRVSHSLDTKTRTMPVELDVQNPELKLSPGMYSEVRWPVRRNVASLLVPPTSIVTTTERAFVIRLKNSVVEWVDVTRGAPVGDLVEVNGALNEGDTIVRRGTDELRVGAHVKAIFTSQ